MHGRARARNARFDKVLPGDHAPARRSPNTSRQSVTFLSVASTFSTARKRELMAHRFGYLDTSARPNLRSRREIPLD